MRERETTFDNPSDASAYTSSQTWDHVLEGCCPTPLAHYLKALGILRLVAEQADPHARGFWHNDHFTLRTRLSREDLEAFFLESYRPTPIVAPWNGGSGFYPKDNKKAIDPIRTATSTRLGCYRATLEAAGVVLNRLGVSEKVSGDEKGKLLEACRGSLPEEAIDWLDAVFLLTEDGPKYPPLLGTGGNDGRLDFTNNFMQRLLDVFEPETGRPTASASSLLASALFDEPSVALQNASIGQFMPGSAGGANAQTGFEADSLINPWDFIFMLEGASGFASAAVRKMERESTGALSYPFTVRQVGAGYASASEDDETSARAEMWMPLWGRPASYDEVRALFSEGRARIGHRNVRNGLDFARAVAGLGVDRGIDAFQRYGFQVRNGLSYLAVPLNRFPVHAEPRVSLIREIDTWLDRFRRRTSSNNAPSSARRALRQLETAILELCQHGDNLRMQQVLIALGRCERVMARSSRWTEEARLQPVPPLSPQWLVQCADESAELRLAASLASVWGTYGASEGHRTSVSIRRQMEPVRTWKSDDGLGVRWDFGSDRDVVWTPAHLEEALNAVMQRRVMMAVQHGANTFPDRGRGVALGDIGRFIEGRIDEARLTDLLWGCILVDWTRVGPQHLPPWPVGARQPLPGALYALLKLCFAGRPLPVSEGSAPSASDEPDRGVEIPIVPQIHRLAATGRGARAVEQAVRRLRGSGLAPALGAFEVAGPIASRSAAALLLPISKRDLRLLATLVLRPDQLERDSAQESTQDSEGAIR